MKKKSLVIVVCFTLILFVNFVSALWFSDIWVGITGKAVDDSSLIGYWKFDGNGNNEISGGPSAVIVGNAIFNSDGGKLGGYAYISSSNDHIKIPYDSAFDLPDSFTIEFWFRQRSNQSFNQNLVYKGFPINNYNFLIFRFLWNQYNEGAVITGFTSSSSGYWKQTSNPNEPPHNVWHHIVYTKSTSGSAYYIDGNLIHSSSYTDSAKTPASDIIIGDSAVDTDIDNLRIYNRALDLGEILANGGFPPREQICTPASKQCSGGYLQQCAADGFAWNHLQYCTYGCDSNTFSCNSAPLQQNQTCFQLNGTICLVSQTCSGSWLTNVTDTSYCCLGICNQTITNITNQTTITNITNQTTITNITNQTIIIPESNQTIITDEINVSENETFCPQGCFHKDNCLPVGIRKKVNEINVYCNITSIWDIQKGEDWSCNNHYECRSNFCVEDECVDIGLIRKIINWFKRLFGAG